MKNEYFFYNLMKFIGYPKDQTTEEILDELESSGIDTKKEFEGFMKIVRECASKAKLKYQEQK